MRRDVSRVFFVLFRVIFGYVTLNRGLSNTPRVKSLHFDLFICIFASDFGFLGQSRSKIIAIITDYTNYIGNQKNLKKNQSEVIESDDSPRLIA